MLRELIADLAKDGGPWSGRRDVVHHQNSKGLKVGPHVAI